MDSRDLIRRLRTFQILFGLIAVVLLVASGDFLFPLMDKAIGVFPSDVIEAIIVGAILWLIAVPQMRVLSRSIVELDELRARFYA